MKKHTRARQVTAPQGSESGVAVMEASSNPASLTLPNLQRAFEGETNAEVRYLTFAKEADEEGYEPVAALFRAVARAEEIHARNHGEAIRGIGLEPMTSLEYVVVKSTHDNLEIAIQGETYERDEMYPEFLHVARSEGNQPAARTFQFAQRAETEHAILFSQAFKELERLRGEAAAYYVCPACGFTSAKVDGSRCPICSNPSDRFERVR
jgi:rubrerythrin